MRRAILAAPLLLAGCGGPGASMTTADIIAAANRACALIQPVLVAATAHGDPRARVYIEYAQAVCLPLAAGAPPATVDANTPLWLDGLAAALKALQLQTIR